MELSLNTAGQEPALGSPSLNLVQDPLDPEGSPSPEKAGEGEVNKTGAHKRKREEKGSSVQEADKV